jgi:mannose-6-phosphate isomerase-like protein (cupin superfamily)
VAIDGGFEVWQAYGNEGWPARYLWGPQGMLVEYHVGEGGYAETEAAIQELLGVDGEPVPPQRPEDVPGARLVPQSPDQEGPWSGRYAAGGVWAVLSGTGTVRVNGTDVAVDHPGAYPLIEHERHTRARLELEVGAGVTCHAVCFTPGVAD